MTFSDVIRGLYWSDQKKGHDWKKLVGGMEIFLGFFSEIQPTKIIPLGFPTTIKNLKEWVEIHITTMAELT